MTSLDRRGTGRPSALTPSAVVAWLAVGSVVAGCAGGVDGPAPAAGIDVADGFEVIEVAAGLDGPTQLSHLSDGRLLVAELNGEEGGGQGRVLIVDLDSSPGRAFDGEREVLFDDLVTPTGVAVLGDEIWVMEQRRLSRGPIDGGQLVTVRDELPFNGRSETTLTATDDGTLLYATTGSLGPDGNPKPDSGVLWEHDPDTGPIALSAGFKNAYAHTIDPDGQLWVTEVSDGRFDGESAPDELVAVVPGVDHGWPRCIGDRLPVVERGADATTCADGPRSQALFEPGATPTSVAVAPWDDEILLVALWRDRQIVAVPTGEPTGGPHTPAEIVSGEVRPQHLLVDGDRLLIVDFDGGRILALQPT